jgi:hypothetical protein
MPGAFLERGIDPDLFETPIPYRGSLYGAVTPSE